MYITIGLADVQTTPRLLGREEQPRAYTLYVGIDLNIGNGVTPSTGIFVPENYRPETQLDLLVYLHGHNNNAQCFKAGGVVPIDQYWKSAAFALREHLNDSGKNIILIAPSLGQTSQSGSLIKPGGFDAYLDQVMAALIAYGPYRKARQAPSLGNIILAAHSGGGSPMRMLALSGDSAAAHIRECWGFDALYGGVKDWAAWATIKKNQPKKLYIYYKNSTMALSEDLRSKKIQNISIVRSNATNCCGCVPQNENEPHCCVPIMHLEDRLRGTSFLSSK